MGSTGHTGNITPKTGKVVRLVPALDTQDLIVITTAGIIIRQAISAISTIGRNTQGVKLIRLDEGDTIADITTIMHEENDDDDDNGMQTQEPSYEGEQIKLI